VRRVPEMPGGAARKTAGFLAPSLAAITRHLIAAEVAHFDETGFRTAGKLAWVHSASQGKFAPFTVHAKRGKDGMKAAAALLMPLPAPSRAAPGYPEPDNQPGTEAPARPGRNRDMPVPRKAVTAAVNSAGRAACTRCPAGIATSSQSGMSAVMPASRPWSTWLAGPPATRSAGAWIRRSSSRQDSARGLVKSLLSAVAAQSNGSGPSGRARVRGSRGHGGAGSSRIRRVTRPECRAAYR
jgi:hypothetical protein